MVISRLASLLEGRRRGYKAIAAPTSITVRYAHEQANALRSSDFSREIPNSCQDQQDYNWNRQQNWVRTIVVQSVRTSNDRSWQANYGEREQADPEDSCSGPGPLLQAGFSLHCEI